MSGLLYGIAAGVNTALAFALAQGTWTHGALNAGIAVGAVTLAICKPATE